MPVRKKTFNSDHFIAEYVVEEPQHLMRIDQFLQVYLPSFSREAIKKKIKSGEVKLLERPGNLRSSTKLHAHDVVVMTIHKTEHEDEYWQGQKLELELIPEILYEDENIIAISKPAFMSTHPTGKHLFNCATVYFESRDHKTIHSIHRIDRETSGVLVLGRNPKATAKIVDSFEKHDVKKCYFFISKHLPERQNPTAKDTFSVDHRLGAKESGLKRVYIDHWPNNSKHGKSAHTDFVMVERFKDYSLGLAFPKSGRQHQIRVHAMTEGLPLLGDKLYLGDYETFQRFKDNYATEDDHKLMEIPRHALHAMAICFPYNGERKIITSCIPNDLRAWMDKNLSYDKNLIDKKIKMTIDDFFKDL